MAQCAREAAFENLKDLCGTIVDSGVNPHTGLEEGKWPRKKGVRRPEPCTTMFLKVGA